MSMLRVRARASVMLAAFFLPPCGVLARHASNQASAGRQQLQSHFQRSARLQRFAHHKNPRPCP